MRTCTAQITSSAIFDHNCAKPAFAFGETHVFKPAVRFVEAKCPKILEPDLVTLFWAFGLGESHVLTNSVRFVESKSLEILEPHFVNG